MGCSEGTFEHRVREREAEDARSVGKATQGQVLSLLAFLVRQHKTSTKVQILTPAERRARSTPELQKMLAEGAQEEVMWIAEAGMLWHGLCFGFHANQTIWTNRPSSAQPPHAGCSFSIL